MQPKFTADEKVLCYHGPLLYEAKILKSKKEAGNYSYFVHYQVTLKSNAKTANHVVLDHRAGIRNGMSGSKRPGS
jgi:hypothetical protein